MSSLLVEIGQCGCQIGSQLNPLLSNSYDCTRNRPPHRLHLIMVDTQPKVLQPILDKQPRWLDPLNVKYFQHGRGNNWSYGYLHQMPTKVQHPQILPKHRQHSHLQPNSMLPHYIEENKQVTGYLLERIRKELETMESAMGIHVIASLGGGSGSGLGTRLIEVMGQQLAIDVYSHVVLPNQSGQNPLQVYNCLLSLASIQEHSSAIFTYENDKTMALMDEWGKGGSIQTINKHLASQIAPLLRFNDLSQHHTFYSTAVSQCVLSSQLKYLTLSAASSAHSPNSWNEVFSSLQTELKLSLQHQVGSNKPQPEYLLAGQLTLVGKESSQFKQKHEKKLRQILNPLWEDSLRIEEVKGAGTHKAITAAHSKNERVQDRNEAILIANHSSIGRYLSYLVDSGSRKYEAKAYLWHYQYADIQNAIQRVASVEQQYRFMSSKE